MRSNHSRFIFLVALGVARFAAGAPFDYQPPIITVPAGFTVELVAAPPLVGHPMMACFDERGRLYIAESAGFNLNEEQLAERRPNFIRRLEDTDGDGVFDRSTIFADKLMIPNGALWLDGALYVAEPPGIWRFTDTDDDGVADKREHIAGNVRGNGMSSSLHGPMLHPGGRLFWCSGQEGYSLEKNVAPPPGRIAPGVFSLTRDGAEHEVFAVGGRANPVEVTFNDEGEVFGTISILDQPDGQRHDALMHWVWGGVHAHGPNDPVPLKRTGPDLPPLSHVGQVAPSGLERYRSAVFGAEFRGDIFWSQFNTRRVVRSRLSRHGATFRARDEDFLVSDSIDFHPTDVLEDADGSLLVIDTGGWFRHGCPTSHIAKPDAKGAIYRIRRTGAPKMNDPRGMEIDWAGAGATELARLLGDARPAVQDRAMAALASQGGKALPALEEMGAKPQTARRNGVWTLARIGTPAARKVIRDKLGDSDGSVRQAAANALGWARDREAAPGLLKLLGKDSPPSLVRETAAALGRIGDARAVAPLLTALALAAPGDAFLQHSLIYALIEIGEPAATARGLADPSPAVRRGALLALGQMDKAALTREQLTPLLRVEDAELQRAAFRIAAREEGKEALRAELWLALREQLPGSLPAPRADLFRETLAAHAGEAAARQLITGLFRDPKTPAAARLVMIGAMRQSSVKPLPEEWLSALEADLRAGPAEVQLAVIALARERALPPLDDTLKALARDAQQPGALRLACLDAIALRLAPVEAGLFDFVESSLAAAATPPERLSAARTLAALRLSDAQLARLAERLPAADALTLPTLLRAFARVTNDAVGTALVAALEKTPAVANVPAEELARLLNKFPTGTQAAAKPLLARLGADLERRSANREASSPLLKALSPLLVGGDIGRGRQVFFGPKSACAVCHRVSGQGGLIGPNLTTIAEVRAGRDLLESVVYPSASIVQGYRAFSVETTDGAGHAGILVRETPEAVWLRGADLAEVKIERARIAAMTESAVSLMPQGLDAALSREELRDLLAFLQSLKKLSSAAAER